MGRFVTVAAGKTVKIEVSLANRCSATFMASLMYSSQFSTMSSLGYALVYHDAGGDNGNIRFLTRLDFVRWLKNEFTLFKIVLKHEIVQVQKAAHGNLFGQGLLNGCTISDKRKSLAIGFKLIDINWENT